MSGLEGIIGGRYTDAEIYLAKALTPIHPGIGRGALGIADVPICRDPFGLPVIPGQSLKGAIRSAFRNSLINKGVDKDTALTLESAIFGPVPERAGIEQWSSAVMILDMNLLMLPVRSLKGVYVLATSPMLLTRLLNILKSLPIKKKNNAINKIESILAQARNLAPDEALVTKEAASIITLENKLVLLETIVLNVKPNISKENFSFLNLDEEDLNKIVIVHDNVMSELCYRGTWIVTRIALDYKTKTVKTGALWTEEYLPPETILYTTILYSSSKVKISSKKLSEVIKVVREKLGLEITRLKCSQEICQLELDEIKNIMDNIIFKPQVLIVGGDETVGRGILLIRKLIREEGEKK